MAEIPEPTEYNQEFYELVNLSASAAARQIVPYLMNWIEPRSVIDVGCGSGAWLVEFARSGCSITGIDGPYLAPNWLRIPTSSFTSHDLEKPFKQLFDGQRFDLVVCLEVAEHLSPNRAESFIDELTAMSDTILFSAAVPGQGGCGHLNEQLHEFWIELMEDRGFASSKLLQRRFALDLQVASWYRSNIYVFSKIVQESSTAPTQSR